MLRRLILVVVVVLTTTFGVGCASLQVAYSSGSVLVINAMSQPCILSNGTRLVRVIESGGREEVFLMSSREVNLICETRHPKTNVLTGLQTRNFRPQKSGYTYRRQVWEIRSVQKVRIVSIS